MAEGEGFEPSRAVRLYRFSRPVVSTAHTPLQTTKSGIKRTFAEINYTKETMPLSKAFIIDNIICKSFMRGKL
jgi:hypothetical protein